MMRYKHILNMASIAGLLSYALFNLYYYVLGFNPLGPMKFLSFGLISVIFYYAIKTHREIELEGFGRFQQLFIAGLVFSFVYSSLNGMLVYLHGIAFDDSYVEFIKTETLQQVGEYKDTMVSMLGKEAYQEMLDEYDKISPGKLAMGDFQSKSISATLLALFFALILKRNPPVFNDGE
ncbi:MAG: DUF4199 domain-containing protein [Flavobacteriales bacterium]